MIIPEAFDAIRPYEPEELHAVFAELLADEQFLGVARQVFPAAAGNPEALGQQLLSCRTNLEFQKKFLYPVVKGLVEQLTTSCDIDSSALSDRSVPCTFISNHRDIVLDPALLCLLLIDDGFADTMEIAIGDNLLAYPWIEKLVRVNKAFIVQRSLSMREMLMSSKRMSDYMHFAIGTKRQSIWIAQREGRAKNSDDRTQESILKMMAMGGEGSPLQRLEALNLVPLTISYEYDPCDYLKAKEFQLKRDNPDYRKSRQDDLENMQTGIYGFKGKVHYQMGTPVNSWLRELEDLPKTDFFAEVARRIDRTIHGGYSLCPGNYVALDMLEGSSHTDCYTPADYDRFNHYLDGRIEKIALPNRDDAFLRDCLLNMYANPLRNYLKTLE